MATNSEVEAARDLYGRVVECLVVGCAAGDNDDDAVAVDGEQIVDLLSTITRDWETGFEALDGTSGGNAHQASISYATGLSLGLVAAAVNANGQKVFRQTLQDCLREFITELLYYLRLDNPLPSAIEHAARVYDLPIYED